jgi:hypothetical protein
MGLNHGVVNSLTLLCNMFVWLMCFASCSRMLHVPDTLHSSNISHIKFHVTVLFLNWGKHNLLIIDELETSIKKKRVAVMIE